jgi:hypothetical protein
MNHVSSAAKLEKQNAKSKMRRQLSRRGWEHLGSHYINGKSGKCYISVVICIEELSALTF